MGAEYESDTDGGHFARSQIQQYITKLSDLQKYLVSAIRLLFSRVERFIS